MTNEFSSSTSWNSAAVAGLVMGAVTIAADYLTTVPMLLGGGMVSTLLTYILKIAKIFVCIYVFRYLMQRFHDTVRTDYTRIQRYGMKTALFSSILVSGFALLQMLVINPDMTAQIVNSTIEAYSGMMDSNTTAAMEKMINVLPAISFFTSLIYCYLWGWVLSTFNARRLFPVDQFSERETNERKDDSNNL